MTNPPYTRFDYNSPSSVARLLYDQSRWPMATSFNITRMSWGAMPTAHSIFWNME